MLAAKNIQNLESLESEILRLQAYAKELEKSIDQKFDYLQDNYSSMAMRSIFSGVMQKAGPAGSLLGLLMENNRLLHAFGRLAELVFDKLADGIELATDKLFNKKTGTPANQEEKDIV